ncbi:MAG TPA: zinc ABC transporter substrate-binding protein [Bauldia sp.]|nr:zinc ABC transporter substrate-binding protein [Bauldia sp.]
MNRPLAALVFVVVSSLPAFAAQPIAIVAAENFYGEAAAAIGGDRVQVTSVIVQQGTDPHDYEPTPSVATAVADAGIVILNGADYDPWMTRLVDASANDQRKVIDVASLIGRAPGDNPHVWYDPKAMPALANALADTLSALDPGGKAGYEQRRDQFLATLAPIQAKIGQLRARFAGTPVTATEPVFGYMAEALGFKMQNDAFQTAIMNETEPSAGAVASMEDDIRQGRVKVLFYNSQVEDPLTQHLSEAAKAAGVPVVGVTETQPAGQTFPQWMLGELDATAKALGAPAS